MQKNSVNKAILVGRLGQKPELKYTTTQTAVTTLSIATTESKKTGSGYEDATEWHTVTLFGSQAEFAEKYLEKGDLVYIEGRIETRSWEKDGVKQYKTGIIGSVITPLSKGKDTGAPQDHNDGVPF